MVTFGFGENKCKEEVYNKEEIDAKAIILQNNINNTNASIQATINNTKDDLQTQIDSLASGSPLVASSTNEMKDTSRIYVNTTNGHWYYHNGTQWVDGGVYQASEDSKTVDEIVERVNNIENLFDNEYSENNLGNVLIRSNTPNNQLDSVKGVALEIYVEKPIKTIKLNTRASVNDNLICVLSNDDMTEEYARGSIAITTEYNNVSFEFPENEHIGATRVSFYTENMNAFAYANYGTDYTSDLIYIENDNKAYLWLSFNGTTWGKYELDYKKGMSFEVVVGEYKRYSVSESIAKHIGAMNYVYVSKVGSDTIGDGTKENPYATIYHANEIIEDNSKNKPYTIIVGQGTYTDLQEKYAGIDGTYYQGIICKDYVYYESENILRPDLCVLDWNGADGYTLPVTDANCVNKCIFHIKDNVNTHIKGFTLKSKNTRYCMHIETVGATRPSEWLMENCIFEWGGRPDTAEDGTVSTACVGTGYTFGEKGIFRNCQFKLTNTKTQNHMVFQTHDNETNPDMAITIGETILFENCYISVADGSEYAHFDLRTTKTTPIIKSFLKLKNVCGMPIYLSDTTYNVEFEGTERKTL